jgi:hypothetical protein
MKYGIINKNKITLYTGVNTTDSVYPAVIEGTPFRTFTTREAARNYKQSLKTPTNYAIVRGCTVVR